MKKRKHLRDGEVLKLDYNKVGFSMDVMCCDCGLVHKFYFRFIKPGKLAFWATRDEKATRASRARRARRFVERCDSGTCQQPRALPRKST